MRLFDEPVGVTHLQLRFSTPFETNQILPLAGAKWHLGKSAIGNLGARVLTVPLDNDVQSMCKSRCSRTAAALVVDFTPEHTCGVICNDLRAAMNAVSLRLKCSFCSLRQSTHTE